MHIYRVSRIGRCDYDCTAAVMVVAAGEGSARMLAATSYSSDNPATFEDDDRDLRWTDPRFAECRLFGTADTADAAIILTDFRAG